MTYRKETIRYNFSVEGETELWYLKWLENAINNCAEAVYRVSFNCKVKEPLKFAKALSVTGEINVYHFSDYESDEPEHIQRFLNTMDSMRKASKLGKQITYRFGYSNLTFDLWIILHKADCNSCIANRNNYISHINRAYAENFASLEEYKREKNFKKCINGLTLSNVVQAVNRAEEIMRRNEDRGYTLHRYKGYEYYKENPSLTVWEAIGAILRDCGLLRAH
jgi:hypothetical protein